MAICSFTGCTGSKPNARPFKPDVKCTTCMSVWCSYNDCPGSGGSKQLSRTGSKNNSSCICSVCKKSTIVRI